jgi:hypothetical protein
VAARFEFKYLVDLDARLACQEILRARLVPGEFVGPHGAYPVLSLYYDGPGLPLYLEKIAGIERRMKVRLRTYAWSFGAEQPWFLEAKHKEGSAIAKRRLAVAPFAVDPLRPETWDALGAEAAPFLHARESLRLEASVGVWYQREVLVSPGGDLRVTWDSPLRALYPGEAMSRGVLYDPTRAALHDTLSVLEIKAQHTVPAWLSELVRSAALNGESVSKYVLALDALGLSRKVLSSC